MSSRWKDVSVRSCAIKYKNVIQSLAWCFSLFSALSKALEEFGINLELPPKKFFGNLKEEFVEKRKVALQKFLDVICSHLLFYAGHAVTSFLQICSVMVCIGKLKLVSDTKEWILLSMRSYPEWSTYRHRPYCGWRAEKQFFEVTSGKASFILTGVKYGPDRCGTTSQLNSALEFIRNINNPHLKESVASWADSRGLVFVRPVFSSGTLRDRLYKSDWREDFYTKYNVDLSICALQVADVRYICRHILEALLILHALSIPFCDVHSGNVLVTDEGCQLIDFEQALTGQSSFYRPSMLKTTTVNNVEDMMVFAFGGFLFELLTGFFSLPMESLSEEIDMVPTEFGPLLKSIFMPAGRKMPTLLEVAGSDLFIDVPVARMNRREIHMPSNVKTTLDGLCSQIIERLENDRNQVGNF
uniref:PX domain-containing protein n=1 Tax=Syphacia muris TaxID=451379 RepID=A0A0N5ANN1_9BILA